MGVIQIQTVFVLAFPVAYAKRKRVTGCNDDLCIFFLNIQFNDTVFSETVHEQVLFDNMYNSKQG